MIASIQKTYRYGINVVELLRDEQKKDLLRLKPIRVVSTATDAAMEALEQEGFDIEYKVEIAEHHK